MKIIIIGLIKTLVFIFSVMMAGYYSESRYGDERAFSYFYMAIVIVVIWIEAKPLLIKIIENKKPT